MLSKNLIIFLATAISSMCVQAGRNDQPPHATRSLSRIGLHGNRVLANNLITPTPLSPHSTSYTPSALPSSFTSPFNTVSITPSASASPSMTSSPSMTPTPTPTPSPAPYYCPGEIFEPPPKSLLTAYNNNETAFLDDVASRDALFVSLQIDSWYWTTRSPSHDHLLIGECTSHGICQRDMSQLTNGKCFCRNGFVGHACAMCESGRRLKRVCSSCENSYSNATHGMLPIDERGNGACKAINGSGQCAAAVVHPNTGELICPEGYQRCTDDPLWERGTYYSSMYVCIPCAGSRLILDNSKPYFEACSGHGICDNQAEIYWPNINPEKILSLHNFSLQESNITQFSSLLPVLESDSWLLTDTLAGGGICYCDEGWNGPTCNQSMVMTEPDGNDVGLKCDAKQFCHSRGICTAEGTCVCVTGFGGDQCEYRLNSTNQSPVTESFYFEVDSFTPCSNQCGVNGTHTRQVSCEVELFDLVRNCQSSNVSSSLWIDDQMAYSTSDAVYCQDHLYDTHHITACRAFGRPATRTSCNYYTCGRDRIDSIMRLHIPLLCRELSDIDIASNNLIDSSRDYNCTGNTSACPINLNQNSQTYCMGLSMSKTFTFSEFYAAFVRALRIDIAQAAQISVSRVAITHIDNIIVQPEMERQTVDVEFSLFPSVIQDVPSVITAMTTLNRQINVNFANLQRTTVYLRYVELPVTGELNFTSIKTVAPNPLDSSGLSGIPIYVVALIGVGTSFGVIAIGYGLYTVWSCSLRSWGDRDLAKEITQRKAQRDEEKGVFLHVPSTTVNRGWYNVGYANDVSRQSGKRSRAKRFVAKPRMAGKTVHDASISPIHEASDTSLTTFISRDHTEVTRMPEQVRSTESAMRVNVAPVHGRIPEINVSNEPSETVDIVSDMFDTTNGKEDQHRGAEHI